MIQKRPAVQTHLLLPRQLAFFVFHVCNILFSNKMSLDTGKQTATITKNRGFTINSGYGVRAFKSYGVMESDMKEPVIRYTIHLNTSLTPFFLIHLTQMKY